MMIRTLLSFAAITALTATSALAQSWRVENAKIPFAFRAGGATMPAGTYEVNTPTGTQSHVITLRNAKTGDSITFLAPAAVMPNPKLEGNMASIEFLCAGSDCAFYRIWPSSDRYGLAVARPKVGAEMSRNGEPAKVEIARVLVPLRASD
jgi:hypothetical protein